jgi:hypothetical protein
LKALISAAVELCLLRLGPQHLPVSSALLGVLLLLNLLVQIMAQMPMSGEFPIVLLRALFPLGLMLAVLYGALKLASKLGRFNQTAIALLLSGLLLDLLALPLFSWYQRTQSVESGLLMLILLFWGIVVIGHIIRHAFDINLGLGVAASVLYTLVSLNLANWLFPVAA